METTKISLEDMANSYLDTLQRTYDRVCYTLAGSRIINEENYDEFSQQLQVMPRQPSRMSFDDAKRSTEQWVLRNSLADSLALVMPVLEDARTVCSLCDFKASGSQDQQEAEKISTEHRAEFLQKTIEDKFSFLEDEFQINCQVKEHVLGLMDLTKALMTKDGFVTEEEATDSVLTIKIRSVQIVQSSEPGASGAAGLNLTRQVGDTEKQFKVGDSIHLNKAEHVGALLTIGIFITDIIRGVQSYAHSAGVADESEQS
ncbi:MAG: hypothetical protein AAF226_00865 [Verrucomicrobiota bacterium]